MSYDENDLKRRTQTLTEPNQHTQSTISFLSAPVLLADNNYNDNITNQLQRESNEEVLSQKFSQLSTSHRTQKQIVHKFSKIPAYLSTKNGNFRTLINNILSTITKTATTTGATANNEEQLYEVAIFTHKMKCEQIFESLWLVYLRSGLGQLYPNQIGPSVWPINVKTTVQEETQKELNTNDACLSLVQQRLHGFKTRIQAYHTELDTCKSCLPDYYREPIYQTIERFIEQNLESLQQKIQHKIALVHYEYKDRVLELEFIRQNPSESCVRLYIVDFLCQSIKYSYPSSFLF